MRGGAALWLLADSNDERFKATAELASSGVSSARLIFSGFQPDKAAHIKRHARLAGEMLSATRASFRRLLCEAAGLGRTAASSNIFDACDPMLEISPSLLSVR